MESPYVLQFCLQVVSGGARYLAEYVIVETNCTADDSDDNCVPLTNAMAVSIHYIMEGGMPKPAFKWTY